jgi:threonine/homoserine/homoserine lactone efflux protein
MIGFATQGLTLGLNAALAPGPLQTFLINNALRQGWRKTLPAAFSPLIIDIPIVIVVVFLLQGLPPVALRILQIVGGLFLLWLAWNTWRGADTVREPGADEGSAGMTLRQGLLVNLLSPGPYIFWATVNGPLLIQAWGLSFGHALAFVVSFYGTFIGLMALMVFVFGTSGRALSAPALRIILKICAVLLVLFALSLIVGGVMG